MKSAATIVALVTVLIASAAGAAVVGFGPRMGLTVDEGYDQFHFGGQAWLLEVFPPPLVLLPSLEIGVGSGVTLVALNGDVVYEFTELAKNDWGFYAGAGLSLNRINNDESETRFGLNVLAGATYRLAPTRTAFGEFRFGVEDNPDFKLTFGLNFF